MDRKAWKILVGQGFQAHLYANRDHWKKSFACEERQWIVHSWESAL